MPFLNASDDADVQYLCDGIAESLTNWLATVPGIKAVSKSAAFRLRDQADDMAIIRSQLGADSVIRGKLEKIGDQIVISASLVDTRDDSQLWGERLVRLVGHVSHDQTCWYRTEGAGLQRDDDQDRAGRRRDARAERHRP